MPHTCISCLRDLPEEAFYKSKTSYCKECWKKRVEKRRDQLKARGCCVECRAPLPEGGTLCLDCKKVHRDRHTANKMRYDKVAKERRQRLKREVFAAYGGIRCNCCSIDYIEFLTIDRVYENGAEQRKQLTKESGWNCKSTQFGGYHRYLWLKRNNYPVGYQVLCFNCNFARSHFGYCPHDGVPDT